MKLLEHLWKKKGVDSSANRAGKYAAHIRAAISSKGDAFLQMLVRAGVSLPENDKGEEGFL